jgi:hypothetical protein
VLGCDGLRVGVSAERPVTTALIGKHLTEYCAFEPAPPYRFIDRTLSGYLDFSPASPDRQRAACRGDCPPA